MDKRQDLAMKIALTALAVACTARFVCSRTFYDEVMVSPFLALALASVVILHLRVFPKLRDAGLIVAATFAMAAVCFLWLRFPHAVMACFSFVGLSSFLVMAVRTVWEKDRRLLLYTFVPAFLFVASDYFASNMLDWTNAAHPRTLDEYLLMFDASLHIQPAFLAGRAYEMWPWLHNMSLIAYVALAVPIAMVYGGRLRLNREKAFPAMLAFLITGPMGILFYNIFPAAGPHNLFGHRFPFEPLPYDRIAHILLEPVAIAGPRNAMPSLHLTWVLLAWWYSRKLSLFERVIAFLFLGLTAFATLGTGEHWLADLVVAFPFALMIQALCAYQLPINDARRRTAFLFGLLTTLAWLVLFRYATRLFWTSPVVPWTLIAATLALTMIRQRVLDAEPALAATNAKWWKRFYPGAAPGAEDAPAVQELQS